MTKARTSGLPLGDRRMARLLMQVLWPSFMVAIIGEGLLFSLIDPHELVVVGVHLADSREAAYTIGFFILWFLLALSSFITWWLACGEPPQVTSRDDLDGS